MIHTIVSYAARQYWELPATILEGITLVLLVFVQDVAFKQSVIVCAALLFTSLILHGLAYRAGQCKVWPKIIELAAPVPFVAMIPPAYMPGAAAATQKSAFIIINLWFAAVEVALLLAGRNFMADYYKDWNPRSVWGTPLLQRCARATAAVWIVAQLVMALAQGLAVAFNLSIDTGNTAAAVFVCYIMQLVPLLFAVVFTFAYPAWLKKRWGYVEGERATCYPPPAAGCDLLPHPAVSCSSQQLPGVQLPRHAASKGCPCGDGAHFGVASKDASILCPHSACSSGSASSSSGGGCMSACVSSGGSQDVLVCISPPTSEGGSKACSRGGVGVDTMTTAEQQQQQHQQHQQQHHQHQQQNQHQQHSHQQQQEHHATHAPV